MFAKTFRKLAPVRGKHYLSLMLQESPQLHASAAEPAVSLPAGHTMPFISESMRPEASGRAKTKSAFGWQSILIPIALFLFSAAILLFKLGQHPGYTQNWEVYTTWRFFAWWDHPSMNIFDVNDGVMLTAGSSPLLAPFIWLSFKLFGVGMFALRLPGALISAVAAPLTFVVGRRFISPRVGLLAALLLALLPSFLVYGRTATNAGLSLVPALITLYCLLRALKEPRQWKWFAFLQVMFIISMYAYTPIRTLWPISIALIAVEILFHKCERWRLAIGLAVTIVALPLVLMFFDSLPGHSPVETVRTYYVAHGETALTIRSNPQNYKYYLKLTPEEAAAGRVFGSDNQLLWRFIKQNATNVINLLFDRHTSRALIDFWNPHGRLYFAFLVPFFLLGMGKSILGIFSRVEDRILQACFWGLFSSLLFVSVVNISRLVYMFPIICFFIASGLFTIVDIVSSRLKMVKASWLPQAISVSAASLLIIATARATWIDYRGAPTIFAGSFLVAHLDADAASISTKGGSAVYIKPIGSLEIEQLDASSYRVLLDDTYRFVDISPGASTSTGTPDKPAFIYGQVIGLLEQPDSIPTYCANIYYVEPDALESFNKLTATAVAQCGQPLHYIEIKH
jgi:4-amino-4-deoxy-L-arabinose transferase-like glycosyltransferase